MSEKELKAFPVAVFTHDQPSEHSTGADNCEQPQEKAQERDWRREGRRGLTAPLFA